MEALDNFKLMGVIAQRCGCCFILFRTI